MMYLENAKGCCTEPKNLDSTDGADGFVRHVCKICKRKLSSYEGSMVYVTDLDDGDSTPDDK